MAIKANKPITGQCHCGAVKYQAKGPILRQGECTCRACQRATGTLGSPNVGVKPDHFQIIQGHPAQYKAAGNEDCDAGIWHFCADCGAPLYWEAPDGVEVAILVGSLDDPSLYKA
jgi:hypothetical protein